MEEILASIRRIVADDSALPLTRQPAPALFRDPPAVAAPAPQAAPQPQPPSSPAPVAVAEPPAVAAPPPPMAAPVGPLAPAYAEPPAPPQPAPEPAAAAQLAFEPAPTPEPISPQPAPSEPEEDILDLAHPFEARGAFEHQEHEPRIGGDHDVSDSHKIAARAAAPVENLLSPGPDASVSSSFQTLAATMFLNNAEMIERVTRDMLRPMLKSWLDDNLPVMVERLVRAEIERVARGGRG